MTRREYEGTKEQIADRFTEELQGLLSRSYDQERVELLPTEEKAVAIVAELLAHEKNGPELRAVRIAQLQKVLTEQLRTNTKEDLSPVQSGETGLRPQVLVGMYLLARARQLRYSEMADKGEVLARAQQGFLQVAPQVLDVLDQVMGKAQVIAPSPRNREASCNSDLHDALNTAYLAISANVEEDLNVSISQMRPHALSMSESNVVTAYGGASKERGI